MPTGPALGHNALAAWQPDEHHLAAGDEVLDPGTRYHPAVEIVGVRITTVVEDNVARRCDGCLEVIDGTPWRLNVLDIVAPERAADWTDSPAINPGPFQFHSDPACARRWMASKGYLFCRKGEVREIMRPIPVPAADGAVRWGLCDGLHRDDHELVPA